jgi:beta-galactosidase
LTFNQAGVHRTTVDDMFEGLYIVPAESGGRSGTRWVAFTDDQGCGLLLRAGAGPGAGGGSASFQFNASRFTVAEWHEAKHTRDLLGEGGTAAALAYRPICVHVDHAMMGIGGDNSWEPVTHEQYLLPAGRVYEYSITAVPLAAGQDPVQAAKTVGTISVWPHSVQPSRM